MLEESYLGFLRDETEDEVNLLMRLTDDYLLVTNNQQKAIKAIGKLLKCARENNFEVNEEKLKTNFPIQIKKGQLYKNPTDQELICNGREGGNIVCKIKELEMVLITTIQISIDLLIRYRIHIDL